MVSSQPGDIKAGGAKATPAIVYQGCWHKTAHAKSESTVCDGSRGIQHQASSGTPEETGWPSPTCQDQGQTKGTENEREMRRQPGEERGKGGLYRGGSNSAAEV